MGHSEHQESQNCILLLVQSYHPEKTRMLFVLIFHCQAYIFYTKNMLKDIDLQHAFTDMVVYEEFSQEFMCGLWVVFLGSAARLLFFCFSLFSTCLSMQIMQILLLFHYLFLPTMQKNTISVHMAVKNLHTKELEDVEISENIVSSLEKLCKINSTVQSTNTQMLFYIYIDNV